jgi:hypothetical protein
MAIKLKEVSLSNATNQYSTEFFQLVAKQPEGKVFAFEQDLPETTIRSRAKQAGEALGVKFTVVTVDGPEGSKPTFAVGVTTKTRKPRAVNRPIAPAEPVFALTPEQWLPSGTDQQDLVDAVEAAIAAEAA